MFCNMAGFLGHDSQPAHMGQVGVLSKTGTQFQMKAENGQGKTVAPCQTDFQEKAVEGSHRLGKHSYEPINVLDKTFENSQTCLTF